MSEKFFEKLDLLNILILLIFSLYLYWPFLNGGFIGGTNDLEAHAYSMWYLKDSIINYETFPAWTSDHFGGRPFLGLYQPGLYVTMLPLTFLFSPITMPKVAFFLAQIVGFFLFYILAKLLFKNIWSALMSSLVYSTFPFILSNLGGGSLANFFAILYVPLMFYLYEKYKEKPTLTKLSLMGLAMGFAFLTHHTTGAIIFATLLFFIAYDYYLGRRKELLKILPFLIIGIMISAVFLLPSLEMKETLNFAVQSRSTTNFGEKDYRPLKIYQALGFNNANEAELDKPLDLNFNKGGTHGEYIGILPIILIFFSFIGLKKENKITKYVLITLFWMIFLQFSFLIPDFLKPTIQTGVRSYALLSTTLSLLIILGLQNASKFITFNLDNYKIIKINKKELAAKIVMIFLLLVVIYDYNYYRYNSSDYIDIPNGLMEFYENISDDKEYYRIEDQSIAPFGSTPIVHNHGVLNGAPSQEAPKYHFWFWSTSWQLLKTQEGAMNFAEVYGALSIKYFISRDKTNLPNFKEVKCGNRYCIYENTKFLKYVRAVQNVVAIPTPEPNHIFAFFDIMSKNVIPLDKIAFVHSEDKFNNNLIMANAITQVNLLEKKPGYLKIELKDSKDGEYLVVAESYHPYWKAMMGGEELKIYEGIPSTLIIPIKGDGIIELKFSHLKLKIYLFYFSLFLILSLIGLIIYDYKYNYNLIE